MNQIILTIDNQSECIKKAAQAIKKGGVVLLPFDTVYGLACDPKNDRAVKKIFKLKSRPLDMTIGTACSSVEDIDQYAILTKSNREYIARLIPGPYTFILPKKNSHLSELCTKNDSIAIRIPDSRLITNLIKACNGIIAQTSANISGAPTTYSLRELKDQFGKDIDNIDLIIDQGEISHNSVSKIIDLTGPKPIIIERS